MKFPLFAWFISSLLFAATAGAQPAHPINPRSGIGWPANCDIYVVSTNSCVSAQGTAANPAGSPGQIQTNLNGAIMGALNNAQAYQNTAGFNKVLLVTANPYNAKCDGSTVDTTAIQAAFTAAQSLGASVQYPAGICIQGTIVYLGQPFFGAGKSQTVIRGLPGQDVFMTPDSAVTLDYAARMRDLSIEVDGTVDASASAAGGNNTYPNRIFGTLGGTTPIPALQGGPPLNGTMVFNAANSTSCGGSISSGANVLTLSCGQMQGISSTALVGGAITVAGAGAAGGLLTTTISGVTSQTTLTLAGNASTTQTTATVNITAPAGKVTPPWYCGNAAFAFPASSGAAMSSGLNGYSWENVQISQFNGSRGLNHICGIFIQTSPYALAFNHVDIMNFWAGYVEAPPASNNTSYFAWTNDTASYSDFNLKFNIIPATFINGTHRSIPSINIYGGNIPLSTGLWWFQINLGGANSYASSGTIGRFYDECWTPNSGEQMRITGSGITVNGGSFAQCYGQGYVNWLASGSDATAAIGNNLHIAGNGNNFHDTQLSAAQLVVQGSDNTVDSAQTNTTANPRRFFVNRPHDPVGKVDGGFLQANSGAAPFSSSSDLLMSCADFNFAFNDGAGGGPGCASDLSDPGNITGDYFHATSAEYGSGFSFGPSSQGTGPLGKLLKVGDRVPQGNVQFSINGRCNATCLANVTVNDITAGGAVASAILQFGTTWTAQSFPVNMSNAAPGDQISVAIAPQWGGGVTSMDLQYIGIVPWASAALDLKCPYTWYPTTPGSCAFDATSPTNLATTIPTAWATGQLIGPGFSWNVNTGTNTLAIHNLANVPTTFGFYLKAASSTASSISLICDGAPFTGATITPTIGTAGAWYYITANLGITSNCNPGTSQGNVGVQFSGYSQQLTMQDLQVLPSVLPTPQPTSNGQVPTAVCGPTGCFYLPQTPSICHATQALGVTSTAPGFVVTGSPFSLACAGAAPGDNIKCNWAATPSGVVGYDVLLNSGNVLAIDYGVYSANTVTINQKSSIANTATFTPGAMSLVCWDSR